MTRPNALLLVLLAVIATSVGLAAVSTQSLWIDEGTTALKAIQPSLSDCWKALRLDGTSNLQMPLHFFYVCLWEKIFGSSEFALRAANIPWFFVALAAFAWGLQDRPSLRNWVIVLTSINAFVWYYLDEARPYLMLFGGSAMLFSCIIRAFLSQEESASSRAWWFMLCLGTLLISATSMIGVPWAMSWVAACLLLLGFKRVFSASTREFVLIGLTSVILLALLAYYAWSAKAGITGRLVERTGWSHLPFSLYEQIGLAGLGPGRNVLRIAGPKSFIPYAPIFIPALLLLAFPLAEAFRFLNKRCREPRLLAILLIALFLPLIFLIALAYVQHIRLFGRHLTPMLPFVLVGLAVGFQRLHQRKHVLALPLAGTGLAILLLSAIEIRFSPRHFRDDYRASSAVAAESVSRGLTVWWCADVNPPLYYKVTFASPGATDGIFPLTNVTEAQLADLPAPAMIVISKPDVYDANNAVVHFAETKSGLARSTDLQAFEIWKR